MLSIKRFIALLIISGSFGFLSAQDSASIDTTKAPDNWFNLDPQVNKTNGVSTERTYLELLKGRKSKTVIVGVIDSGVDFEHKDLKEVMWVNEKEIPGNGIDDDKNGYVDDIYGWNFIGGKDGKNIDKETLELTRLYRDLSKKYQGKDEKEIPSKQKKEFKYFLEIQEDYKREYNKIQQEFVQLRFINQLVEQLELEIKDQLSIETVTISDLDKFKPKDKQQEQLISFIKMSLAMEGMGTLAELAKETEDGVNYYEKRLKFSLNLEYDPRPLVGDDPNNPYEKYYGNNDVKGPSSGHGTHVAGIIAASRTNGIGIMGVADNVRIMSIRAVPDGDERDKDVANAIIYAVDNGAKVINMSFGKRYSVHKEAVDKAVKYAESKDVLLLHAAGNDALNIDEIPHYPSKRFLGSKKEAKNWLDIGALSWRKGKDMPAPFSNYGKKTVDIFAPGVDIYSVKTDGGYIKMSGTSMATPVTAGVAAVLRSYFPSLTAKQVKEIIVKSAITENQKSKVKRPGLADELNFDELCRTGGVVNLYKAVELAQKMTGLKS